MELNFIFVSENFMSGLSNLSRKNMDRFYFLSLYSEYKLIFSRFVFSNFFVLYLLSVRIIQPTPRIRVLLAKNPLMHFS